jgi:hypothetical protein
VFSVGFSSYKRTVDWRWGDVMQVMRIPEAVSTVGNMDAQTQVRQDRVYDYKAMESREFGHRAIEGLCIALNTTILGIIFQVGFHIIMPSFI